MTERALLFAAILGACLSAAGAATVVLQQHLGDYRGSSGNTLWGKGLSEVQDKQFFYLRGAHNRILLRFELPKELADKRLARARLCLFLPKAEKANFYTEILCHALCYGPPFDVYENTDYSNGRPIGVVDSVELFAPPHEGWNHFPWLPLGIPEGGKWIEFNITPLVEVWLREPKRNDGLALVSCFRRNWTNSLGRIVCKPEGELLHDTATTPVFGAGEGGDPAAALPGEGAGFGPL